MAQMQQNYRHAAKSEKPAKPAERADAALAYQSGFGNQFATEAMPGALPRAATARSARPTGSMRS